MKLFAAIGIHFLLLLLTACGNPSPEALHHRLQSQMDHIAMRLEKIENYDELKRALPLLKVEFEEIAETMVLYLELYPDNFETIRDERLSRASEKMGEIEGGEALLREAMRRGREVLFSHFGIIENRS